MDKIDNSERIDRFFREQMSLEERNTFLEDLKNDKELREEAQITALLIQELKEERSKQEQEIAQEIRMAKSSKNPKRIIYWVGSIAAMFILIFGSVRFYQIKQMDNLFNEYYSPYESQGMSRGGDDDVEKELANLFNQIETEEDVAPTLQKLQSIYDKIDSEYEYSLYADDISWYLALGYIKVHDIEKASRILHAIHVDDDESEFGQKVKELLKELE